MVRCFGKADQRSTQFLGTKAEIILFLSLDRIVKSDDSVGNDDGVEYSYDRSD